MVVNLPDHKEQRWPESTVSSTVLRHRLGDSNEVLDAKMLTWKDQNSARQEYFVAAPKFFQQLLAPIMKDKRDMPMIHLMFNITFFVVPLAVGQFFLPFQSHAIGIIYLLSNYLLFTQRFILWLHYSAHVKTFKETSQIGWLLNRYAQMIVAPLYGIPSGMYYLHHVVMHHCENNLFPYDVSSTEPYNRGNFLHFLVYFVKFWIAIWFELPYYAFRRSRYRLLAFALISEVIYLTTISVLYQVNSVATLYVFLLPLCISAFALMFGNFSQHIFIDPANPRSNYKLTFNVINCDDNMRSFNDGYHIIHHVNSKLHWTELPNRFMATLDEHLVQGAFIFNGVGFFDVGVMVFTRQFEKLADCMIQLGCVRRNKQDLITLLKARLGPIPQKQLS